MISLVVVAIAPLLLGATNDRSALHGSAKDAIISGNSGIGFDCSLPAGTPAGAVAGTLTVSGTLTLQVTGAPCPAGKTYVLIDNDGTDPIIGTFDNIPEGGIIAANSGQLFLVTYKGGTGNDLVATAISDIPELGDAALALLAAAIAFAGLTAIRR